MFKLLAAVATVAAVVVAQDQPLWEVPKIGPECNGDCVGMLKFQDKCQKQDLTCLVAMCTDPDTVTKCLTCAKVDTKQFTDGCAQVKQAEANGSTTIPTGTAADAIVSSAKASMSEASATGGSATSDAASSAAAESGSSAAAGGAGAATSSAAESSAAAASGSSAAAASGSSAAAAPSSSQKSSAGKLAPAAFVGAAGLVAALF